MPHNPSPMRAEGRLHLPAAPATVLAAITDPAILARIIPGADTVSCPAPDTYAATLALGVGPFRARQTITLKVTARTQATLTVEGHATGPFGSGRATGTIGLNPGPPGQTTLAWRYDGTVTGPVTVTGPTLLRLAATAFTTRVFRNLHALLAAPPQVR